MKRFIFLALWMMAAVGTGFSQSAITATIQDSDGTAWVAGSYALQLVSSTGQSVPQGQAFRIDTAATVTTTIPAAALDGTGSLSTTLVSNSNINPSGTRWQFTICPNTIPAKCGSTTLAVNSSGSLSTQLSAAITAPRIGGGIGIQGYADVEANAVNGNTYYNVTSVAQRCYANNTWGLCGQSGGGGPPSGAAGGALSGTYPNPGITGTTISPKIVNGTSISCQYSGSTLDVRVNAAMSDAINLANGNTTGVVDSTCEAGTQTIAATITVGSSSNPGVKWIHPAQCNWTASGFSGGTAAAIYQYGGSAIVGDDGEQNCNVNAGTGLFSVYETATTGSSYYFRLKGMRFYNGGFTMGSGATMVVNTTQDGSYFEDVGLTNYVNNENSLLINDTSGSGSCCSTTFNRIVAAGNHNSGAILNILTSNSSGATAIQFTNSSFGHPAPGFPVISCTNSTIPATAQAVMSFDNVYIESNATDTTTPLISSTSCQNLKFSGVREFALAGSSTAPGIQLNGTYNTAVDLSGLAMFKGFTYPAVAVQNEITGFGCVTAPCNEYTDANGNLGHWATTPGVNTVSVVAGASSAAAQNTAAINQALANGGTVIVPGNPGQEVFVNTPIILHSHSKLMTQQGVFLEQANSQNTNLVVNYAFTQPFVSSGVSITWTSGLTATLTWPSHGQVAGNYIYVQGTSYYLSGTYTYVSGASACTNGTQIVQMQNAQNFFITVGTITVSGGVPTGAMTITNPQFGFETAPTTGTIATCTGTATFSGGTITSNDTAYSGVFPVLSVTDTNNVVIQLKRIPAAASVGVVYVKQADVDIQTENLNLDWNTANNTASGYLAENFIISGVQNCRITNTSVKNTLEYGITFVGVRDCTQDGFYTPTPVVKDGIKVYGPTFDSNFGNMDAIVGDDMISIQPMDAPGFLQYMPVPYGGGDTLNVRESNIHGSPAGSCTAIYGDYIHTMDDITLDRLSCHPTSTNDPIIIRNGATSSGTSGTINNLTVSNMSCPDDYSGACVYVTGINVGRLNIDQLVGPTTSTTNVQDLVYENTTGAIGELNIKGLRFYPFATTDTAVNIFGTVGNLNIFDYYANAATAAKGAILNLSAVSSPVVDIHDGKAVNIDQVVTSAGSGTPYIKLTNNVLSSSGSLTMIQASTASTFNIANNTLLASSGSLIKVGGSSITYTLNSGGGNYSSGSYLGSFGSGTTGYNVYGGCGDIKADISQTYILNAAGGCVYNTNTTYAPVGPVQNNGTYWIPQTFGFQGLSGSIGGSALLAGACSTGTVTINGLSASTTYHSVVANPVTAGDPGAGNVWYAQVTAANTVTVSVCAIVAGTPTATTYAVTVQ